MRDLGPSGQFVSKRVQLALPLWRGELRFNRAGVQMLRDRIARQTSSKRNLADLYRGQHLQEEISTIVDSLKCREK